MPQKSGQYFDCVICGEQFYRQPSHIRRGITKTCGKTACKSVFFSGEGNGFYGQNHKTETKEDLTENWDKRHLRKPGPPKGFTHTKEARKKITEALRERWINNRDEMLTYAQQGLNAPRHDLQVDLGHRIRFTKAQKKMWMETNCFYCNTTEDLILDHILPGSCGGKRVKTNAQTLCQPCNRWKMRYVDTPLYFAMLERERG